MKIRDLTAEDFYKLSEIFTDVMDEVGEQLKDDMSTQQAGIKVFSAAFRLVPTKIRSFIADLAGVDDAKSLPFTAPVKIAREIINREEMKDFFHQMRELMQEMRAKF